MASTTTTATTPPPPTTSIDNLSTKLTTIHSTLSQLLRDDITTLPIPNQQSIIFAQSNELTSIISTLQIHLQQFDATCKAHDEQRQINEQQFLLKQQQFDLQCQNRSELLDIRTEKVNNREDNLIIKEEQMKMKETRLDLQEKEQHQQRQQPNSADNINIHHSSNITTNPFMVSLFEKEQQLVFLQDRLNVDSSTAWDALEVQQQRRLLEEEKECVLIEYYGMVDELETKRKEDEERIKEDKASIEKKRKKLSKMEFKMRQELGPQMASLLERESALKQTQTNIETIIQQRIEAHQHLLFQQEQHQLLLKRNALLRSQLDMNKYSFSTTHTYPLVRYSFRPLGKNTVLNLLHSQTWFSLFNDPKAGFIRWFLTDSKAGLLPNKDNGKKIFLSSPHVLDGQWVQVQGEGVDPTVIDSKKITLGHFFDRTKPHNAYQEVCGDDLQKGQQRPYNFTILIKWE